MMADETKTNQQEIGSNKIKVRIEKAVATKKGEYVVSIPYLVSRDGTGRIFIQKTELIDSDHCYFDSDEKYPVLYYNPDNDDDTQNYYTIMTGKEIAQLVEQEGKTNKVPVNLIGDDVYDYDDEFYVAIIIPVWLKDNELIWGHFYLSHSELRWHGVVDKYGNPKESKDTMANFYLDRDKEYLYFYKIDDVEKQILLTGKEIAQLVWLNGKADKDLEEKFQTESTNVAKQDESDVSSSDEGDSSNLSNVDENGEKGSEEEIDENIAKETLDNISEDAGDNNTEGSTEGNIEKEPEKIAEDVTGEEKRATTEEPEKGNTYETASEEVAGKSEEDTHEISDETIKKQEDAINLFGYFFDGLSSNINTLNSQVHNLVLNESNESTAAQTPKEVPDIIQYKPIKGYKDGGKGELADYIFDEVSKRRPNYSRADILNIAICITQGFLTVFSGAPGCGKTSICDIFADVLGLDIDGIATYSEQDSEKAARYVSVSVEEGWTSKKDFIGYYNPLTGSMEAAQSNHNVYDVMEELNTECIDKENGPVNEDDENNPSVYPCIILLDEANLSPMEYYWSDFMKVGDLFFEETYAEKAGKQDRRFEPEELTKIYMGKRQDPEDTFKEVEVDFRIPDTLRFIATINNDYTTNALSPRLTDRAWVITLPENQDDDLCDSGNQQDKSVTDEESSSAVVVSMQDLQSAFDKYTEDQAIEKWNGPNYEFVREIYKGLVEILNKMDIVVSPRARRSILRYWATGTDVLFDIGKDENLKDEYKNDKEKNDNGNSNDLTDISKHEDIKFEDNQLSAIIALDYAVSQRILPQIDGNGEEFGTSIRKLKERCRLDHLQHSYKILSDIWDKGNEMNYYKFYN